MKQYTVGFYRTYTVTEKEIQSFEAGITDTIEDAIIEIALLKFQNDGIPASEEDFSIDQIEEL